MALDHPLIWISSTSTIHVVKVSQVLNKVNQLKTPENITLKKIIRYFPCLRNGKQCCDFIGKNVGVLQRTIPTLLVG